MVRPIIRHAETVGVTLVLENEPYDASATPKGMRRIITAIDSPHFKINFDPTNFYQGNVEAFPYAYELLKDHIAYIHLKNGCRYIPEIHREYGKGGPFAPPNDAASIFYPTIQYGDVNIEGLLDRLQQDGYRGFCTLEPHVTLNNLSNYHRLEIAYMWAKGIR
jgi:sugar phosphate isomerase/epimerase